MSAHTYIHDYGKSFYGMAQLQSFAVYPSKIREHVFYHSQEKFSTLYIMSTRSFAINAKRDQKNLGIYFSILAYRHDL